MKKPEKKRLLDLNANILDVNAYVRHKERVIGYNQASDKWEKWHQQEIKIVLDHIERLESTISMMKGQIEILRR